MKIRGRPKSKTTFVPEWPIFPSMAEMAAQLNTTTDLLKHAKKSGCAFASQNNRCDSLPFTKWLCLCLTSEDGTMSENWDRKLKEFKAKREKLDYEEKLHLLIEFAPVRRFIDALMSGVIYGELERLAQEFPVTLEGKTKIAIHKEVKRQTTIIVDQINSKMDELVEMGKPEGEKT